MKIKIVSDGGPLSTRVVNAETGETLEGVVGVEWEHSAPGQLPRTVITVLGVPVEVYADIDTDDDVIQQAVETTIYDYYTDDG